MDRPQPTKSNLVPFPHQNSAASSTNAANEVIHLGSLEFNRRDLTRKLRNDLKDDWFPDPRQFKDMLDPGLVVEHILRNFEANHGEYVPHRRDEYNLPKPNFTLRYALEIGIADRMLYHGLTDYLIPFFDPLIPWTVFNHRYNRIKPSHKAGFLRGVDAWKHFHGSVRSCLRQAQLGSRHAALLSTDISNFYEYIDLGRLKATLLSMLPRVGGDSVQKSRIRAHIDLLFGFLQYWAFDSSRGLPQNRDASSFLANMYMHPVDIAMVEKGYAAVYFRYMDDIKIVCNDVFHARRALKELSIELRKIGLSLNSKKTEICEANDTESISQHLNEASADAQVIDEMWRSRSRSVILRSFPILADLAKSVAAASKFDSKDFRFCVHKLRILATCPDFEVPDHYFHELTPALLHGLTACPASTDKLADYLIVAPTRESDLAIVASHLCDEPKCLYSWQNYLLWTVLARKKYITDIVKKKALAIVNSSDDSPTRAGATLYLGVAGNLEAKTQIVAQFSSLRTFMGQRTALLAVHELPFEMIKGKIPGLRQDLTDVYRGLHQRAGTYFEPVERRPLTELIDSESNYD